MVAVQLEENSKDKSLITQDILLCHVCQNSWIGTVQGVSNRICRWEKKYLSTKKLCYGFLKPIYKPIWQGTIINIELAKFTTKNILFHCIDLSSKQKPSYELSMIHLIKVTRHKMEFGKTMLEYVTKILFAHPLKKCLSDQYLCRACHI